MRKTSGCSIVNVSFSQTIRVWLSSSDRSSAQSRSSCSRSSRRLEERWRRDSEGAPFPSSVTLKPSLIRAAFRKPSLAASSAVSAALIFEKLGLDSDPSGRFIGANLSCQPVSQHATRCDVYSGCGPVRMTPPLPTFRYTMAAWPSPASMSRASAYEANVSMPCSFISSASTKAPPPL